MTFDEAAFLPYLASFERFVPRYIAWLHARDRNGVHWLAGESKLMAIAAAMGGRRDGRRDRSRGQRARSTPALELIDYKTVSTQELRNQVRQPHEDTQLAFYAALMVQSSRGTARPACVLPFAR